MVTVDGDTDEQGIDLDYLKRVLTVVPVASATIVIILDCCHAGAAVAKESVQLAKPIRAHDIAQAIPSLSQGRVVLAACRGDQLAYEDSNLGHGIFTSVLLQALLGDAADAGGEVSVPSVYEYVSRVVSLVGMQTPVLKGDIAGRVVLGRGFEPRVTVVVPTERAAELEREAQRHLEDYQKRAMTSYSDLAVWRAEGHKFACQTLEPLLRWFDRQTHDHPYMESRQDFRACKHAAMQRLAALSGLEPGMSVRKGTIVDKLGSGTFGSVWKVATGPDRPVVAYKVYHGQEIGIAEKLRRFSRGYSAMKQLDHPHIVKVHDYTNCPVGFYMDYIDGPNLRSFIGTLDEPDKLITILLTVGETLRHAHKRGIVHRDVKPENIVMSRDAKTGQWRPFLTDFDLAWFSTATQVFTREGMGSVYYASPEQYATPTANSARATTTDVFSFGQLSFFVITGSDPVPLGVADNYRALEKRLGAGWFSEAAAEFLKLYSDCTQPKYSRRPTDFSEICDRMFEVSQLLKTISSAKSLTIDQFMPELVFAMVGLSSENQLSPESFFSLSTKTRVAVESHREYKDCVDLSIEFHCQVAPVLEGVQTYEQLRKILLGRIDSALTAFAGARKRHGSVAPFQAFVDVDGVPLSHQGVAFCRSLISRIIDVV